jgi:hypothetical protein
MKNVLDESEETLKYRATERYAQSWNDPRMLAQVTVGGSGGGGSGQVQVKPESVMSKIKRELGL